MVIFTWNFRVNELSIPITGKVWLFLLHLPLTKASEIKRVESCN